MKIAIPVDEDRTSIYKRTGQTPWFAIYEDGIRKEDIPNDKSPYHDENEEKHKEHINTHIKEIRGLKGVDVILVKAMGVHLREALEFYGIKIQKIDKELSNDADEVARSFFSVRGYING